MVSTLFLATINPVAAAPFFYGEFMGATAGGISAWQNDGDIGRGVLFGTVTGGATGGLAMGFKDYMLGTAFANQIISPMQGGLITAGEFAIGGFGMGLIEGYAGGANSWSDAFKHAGMGAAIGAGIGFTAGYSYTAGWQKFLHGADTLEHNWELANKQRVKMIKDLAITPEAIEDFTNPKDITESGPSAAEGLGRWIFRKHRKIPDEVFGEYKDLSKMFKRLGRFSEWCIRQRSQGK